MPQRHIGADAAEIRREGAPIPQRAQQHAGSPRRSPARRPHLKLLRKLQHLLKAPEAVISANLVLLPDTLCSSQGVHMQNKQDLSENVTLWLCAWRGCA